MTITMGPIGSGPTITFPDGRTVDLSRKIRLTKTELSSGGAAFTCEGVLADAPGVSTIDRGLLRIHLRFIGGAVVDWVPELGDMIENVA